MGKRIKIGLFLVVASLLVLGGCGNKPNKDVQEVIDAIADRYNQSDEEHDWVEDDFSFKVYYSELLDTYVSHTFVPYVSITKPNKGELTELEWMYSYHLKELSRLNSINHDLPSILTEGNYVEVYRSGKFDE